VPCQSTWQKQYCTYAPEECSLIHSSTARLSATLCFPALCSPHLATCGLSKQYCPPAGILPGAPQLRPPSRCASSFVARACITFIRPVNAGDLACRHVHDTQHTLLNAPGCRSNAAKDGGVGKGAADTTGLPRTPTGVWGDSKHCCCFCLQGRVEGQQYIMQEASPEGLRWGRHMGTSNYAPRQLQPAHLVVEGGGEQLLVS
jgi:hypothetical protein